MQYTVQYTWSILLCTKKIDSTLQEHKGVIARLAKIPTFYRGKWDPWIKKGVNYFSCIEGKGGLKDIHWSAQNAALFVDLL